MVTSDLGRVTTYILNLCLSVLYCGDVRSRTSYNYKPHSRILAPIIVVTSDLGRVTTESYFLKKFLSNCGDVRSRTSYNSNVFQHRIGNYHCGDVRSRTSYNTQSHHFHKNQTIVVTSDLGRVTTSSKVNPFFSIYCGDVRSRTSYN